MITDRILRDFIKTNMGWLSSEGELLVCLLHNHMERLATVPVFEEAYWRYTDICDGNETAMQEDLDSLGPDDHPAMHRFCGMNDDAKDELVKVVYTAGWVRLGRAFDMGSLPAGERRSGVAAFRNPSAWYLEAEGLTEAVRRHRKILEDLAGALGCRLVKREMKYEEVNFGSKRKPKLQEILVPENYAPV